MTFNLFSFSFHDIILKIFFSSKRQNHESSEENILFKKTNIVSRLVSKIKEENINDIYACSLSYSYIIDENNLLNIVIKINGINDKMDDYIIYQLGNNDEIDIKLEFGNTILNPTIIEKDNDFTVFHFKLRNQNPHNLKITIKQKIRNMKQNADLFFVPRNYLRNVDKIKIYGKVKCYLACNENEYDNNIITFDETNPTLLMSKNNKNYVDSVFFIPDYKRTYEKK